ncbi:MAG: efflux transporter outer membrane subunit [Paucibacter sp.]|nr:efflux transporter outer membrane subunit [Roseateles sp.]
MNKFHLLPLLAALLGGCAITHVEPPKPAAPPAQFKESGDWTQARTEAATPEAWWTLFQDPVLDELQGRLLIGNENLRSAATQVANARALLDAAQSAFWPTLSVAGQGARSKNPGSRPANSSSLTATAGWEIDLWGSLSEGLSQANAQLRASQADLASARLSAQALLVQGYFTLRAAEVQQDILDRSVTAYERSLDLTRARRDAGVVATTDVLQAETQLRSAQAQAADAKAQRAVAEHALAVLLGVPPSNFSVERHPAGTGLAAVPTVPALLPATLMERRPDIAAAAARVKAAYAAIGIANAAYFPTVSLSADGGWRENGLKNLVSTPNLFWSLGASLAQTVFDGGRRELASAQARNNADSATSSYRQTVLAAMQEVEDNLVLARQLQDEAQLQQDAVHAARRNLEITEDQYKAGTVSYLNIVTAQTALLTAENTLNSVKDRQLVAVNQLLKNIAGRWE